MNFSFSDDQLAFRDAVRTLLDKECSPEAVRAAWSRSESSGRDRDRPSDVWRRLSEMGVAGMTAPEEAGGLGMTDVDLVLVLEESGRAAVPEPVIEHVAVAVPAVRDGGGKIANRWLEALAGGDVIATVGLGVAPLVPDADRATLLLDDHDGCLHLIELASCDVNPVRSVDGGRPLFTVAWSAERDTKVDADFALAFDRAAVGAAAQLVGLTDRMISMAVEYASAREQFGRAIGSFQAVQHRLADALLRLEFARPAVYRAAYALAHDEPDRSVHVSMAKAYAGEAANIAARAALQVHGAIGYSWEHDLHLFMKRAWSLAAAYGDVRFHRRRVGDWLWGSTKGATNG